MVLKLNRLPDRTPVKLNISVSPDLHAALSAYATLYAETYGDAVALADLLPPMLMSFIDSDRGFLKARREKIDRPPLK